MPPPTSCNWRASRRRQMCCWRREQQQQRQRQQQQQRVVNSLVSARNRTPFCTPLASRSRSSAQLVALGAVGKGAIDRLDDLRCRLWVSYRVDESMADVPLKVSSWMWAAPWKAYICMLTQRRGGADGRRAQQCAASTETSVRSDVCNRRRSCAKHAS